MDDQSEVKEVLADRMEVLAPTYAFVEPDAVAADGKSAVWRLSVKSVNALRLSGSQIPYTMYVCFSAVSVNWKPSAGGPSYTTVKPREESGGFFANLPLHSVVYAIERRGVGGRQSFCIEAPAGQEVIACVNDVDYSDNDGEVIVKLNWR